MGTKLLGICLKTNRFKCEVVHMASDHRPDNWEALASYLHLHSIVQNRSDILFEQISLSVFLQNRTTVVMVRLIKLKRNDEKQQPWRTSLLMLRTVKDGRRHEFGSNHLHKEIGIVKLTSMAVPKNCKIDWIESRLQIKEGRDSRLR